MLKISRPDISYEEIQQFPAKERFIKIPIENYLGLLPGYKRGKDGILTGEAGMDPIPPQIALINALNNPKYRFVTAALSRRTGKTEMSNIIAQLVSFVPGSNILIISPNYNLSSISWDLQRKYLNTFDVELDRSNAKDKVIELKNKSTIRMASVSQADSAVGRSYDFIIFDECALEDKGETAFNIQLRPTLDKPSSKVVFISTPRGKNWFYQFFERGFSDEYPMWASIHSDYLGNPRAIESDVDEARKSMSKAEFDQEYHASFVSLQGQIYDFKKEENVKSIDLDSIVIQDVIIGIDIGFKDKTALAVIVTDGHKFYIIDEYVKGGTSTAKHAEKIQFFIDKYDVDFIYIDSAAAQTAFDLAMLYDISTVKAKKDKLPGISYVASVIDNNRLEVDSKCTHVLKMLDTYVWDDRQGLIVEKPKHDDASHIADAVRYALYTHNHNVELDD